MGKLPALEPPEADPAFDGAAPEGMAVLKVMAEEEVRPPLVALDVAGTSVDTTLDTS